MVDWLDENYIRSVKEIHDGILQGIVSNTEEALDERNKYIDAMMDFSDACGDLVKLLVREESTGIKQDKEASILEINSKVKMINEFCKAKGIVPLPEKDAAVLAFELIDEYRPK